MARTTRCPGCKAARGCSKTAPQEQQRQFWWDRLSLGEPDNESSGPRIMPNPQSLKVGDFIRFISIPEEWSRPGYLVSASSRAFMKAMIKRGRPSRVYEIDEY